MVTVVRGAAGASPVSAVSASPESQAASAMAATNQHRPKLLRHIGSDLLERSPGEEQALLPHGREPYDSLRLLAGTDDVEDHALTPASMTDVVAGLEADGVRTGGSRRAGSVPR